MNVAVGMLVGRVADGPGVTVSPNGNGVNVAVCTSHQARGGGWVGAGVLVGVPVLKATAVPVAAHASGVTGRGVGDGSGLAVIHQQ